VVLKPELLERWRTIVLERFPDQEYVLGGFENDKA
jgi:hypothetical protein